MKGDGKGVLFQDVSPWGAVQAQRGSDHQICSLRSTAS